VRLRRRSNIAWMTNGADAHVDLSSRLGIAGVVWTAPPTSRRIVLTNNIEAARLKAEEFASDWEVCASAWWSGEPTPLPDELGSYRLGSDWPEDALGPLRWSLTDLEMDRVRTLG